MCVDIAATLANGSSGEHVATGDFVGLMKEVRISLSLSLSPVKHSLLCFPLCLQAMDGFLIVLDKEANILYVSETITGYVGLSQVGVNVDAINTL